MKFLCSVENIKKFIWTFGKYLPKQANMTIILPKYTNNRFIGLQIPATSFFQTLSMHRVFVATRRRIFRAPFNRTVQFKMFNKSFVILSRTLSYAMCVGYIDTSISRLSKTLLKTLMEPHRCNSSLSYSPVFFLSHTTYLF